MTLIAHAVDLDELIQLARFSFIARYGTQPKRLTHQEDILAEFFPPVDPDFLEQYGPQMSLWEFPPGAAATPDERYECERERLKELLFEGSPNFDEVVAWSEAVWRTKQKLSTRGMASSVGDAVSSVIRHFWPDEISSRDALQELVNSQPELLAELKISSHMEARVALKRMVISRMTDPTED